MTEGDVDYVHASGIKVEAFQTTSAEADDSPFWPKDRLRRWVQSGEDVLLIAESEGSVVGYFLSHLHETTGATYIENVYVEKNYRRQGIGEQLVREGVDRIVANGGRYISALTKTDNEAMQGLLQKVDFNQGENFVWMDKICE